MGATELVNGIEVDAKDQGTELRFGDFDTNKGLERSVGDVFVDLPQRNQYGNNLYSALQYVNGAQVEKILDMASITLKKKSVSGDKSAIVPGGIRIGTPALTTRGFTEEDFMLVADFIHDEVKITQEAKKLALSPKLQDFLKSVTAPDFPLIDQVLDLKRRVEDLATQFPLPGS